MIGTGSGPPIGIMGIMGAMMRNSALVFLSGVVFALACGSDDAADEAGIPADTGGDPTTGGTSSMASTGTSAATTTTTTTTTTSSMDDASDNTSPCMTPVVFTPDDLPPGEVGARYSVTIASNQAGDWSIVLSGDLPSGLTWMETNQGATISGVPADSGTFPLEASLLNADGGWCPNASPMAYTLLIEDAPDTGSTGTDGSTSA